jgi:predicted transcriptional regulator
LINIINNNIYSGRSGFHDFFDYDEISAMDGRHILYYMYQKERSLTNETITDRFAGF